MPIKEQQPQPVRKPMECQHCNLMGEITLCSQCGAKPRCIKCCTAIQNALDVCSDECAIHAINRRRARAEDQLERNRELQHQNWNYLESLLHRDWRWEKQIEVIKELRGEIRNLKRKLPGRRRSCSVKSAVVRNAHMEKTR